MTLHEQRWIPDTCANPATNDSCSIIEVWDDAVAPESRTYTLVRIERLCSRHAAAHGANHAAAFTANYDQNRRKNITFSAAQTIKAGLLYENMVWSFSADGILNVSFGGLLTTNQKNQLQSTCDLQFGINKVVVSP